MEIIDYDLISVQEARILAENAREASKSMLSFPQEKLDEIVKSMVHGVSGHVKELAVMSSEETEYGKWEDKLVKNRFVCEALPPKLSGMRCVGVIFEDKDKKVMDVGVPLGVIVALPPATSPVSTVIYKALIAVKSGNAIIFSPHPRARGTICRALDLLIEAAEGAGLPKGGISCMRNVTGSGTVELMNHPATSLIMNTGVPGMLDAAN
ncbi:MAG: aldehyde dehydrogenase family protein, partial [Clostridiales bacterium]|nr:aldehyde dehydrogenase family protein [Clostridiales bacterium]